MKCTLNKWTIYVNEEREYDNEEDRREAEELKEAAHIAFSTARQEALDAGLSIVEAVGDKLYRIYPDRTSEYIKDLEPDIPVNEFLKNFNIKPVPRDED